MINFSATVTCQYESGFSPFMPEDFDGALAWAKESGLDGVEICVCDYHGVDINLIKQKLQSHGLCCSTISTGQAYGREGISLSHEDASKREQARLRIFEHIKAAGVLNSRVTIGLLRGRGERYVFLKEMEKCLAAAEAENITLLLEPINRYETPLLNSAKDAMDFLKDLGNPSNAGILWDIFHANIEDPSFETAIETMVDSLKHVHLADSNRMFPGFGHIDFNTVFSLLRRSGFSGWASFECANQPSREHVTGGSARFIQQAKDVWRD